MVWVLSVWSLHVLLVTVWVYSEFSGFLPQSKDMHVIGVYRGCWYKLLDKSGKADKERGEVLLDIQFMRNNMTASMFDLSMPDKPRSRLSKFKDKVRGKKKDEFADSVSAIVPAGQILTDSEDDEVASTESPKLKKSSKFKTLFGSKTNLHRGVSQSMSTLGTLPEKNSPLSSSRPSGLNEESAEGKTKLKFLGHTRNSSTDSKISLGPFSLLNRSKQNTPDQSSLCINGSHVYAEDQESLSGSAKGSIEDLRKYHERNASAGSTDSFKGLSIPSYKPDSTEREFQVQQRHPEDEKHKKPEGRMQELLAEQERKKQQEQDERWRKVEEEEKKMLQERERKQQAEEEQQRKKREEEARKAEEQKRQEESRVTERLTSLFGLGRKKEEHVPPAVENPKKPEAPNPFEEIPLSEETPAHPQKEVRPAFTPVPPSSGFPARTAKVSAVKPRLTLSQKTETDNTDSLASPVPSDSQNSVPASTFPPEASPYSDPFESFDMFSNLHSSMAPPKPQRTISDLSRGSMENLSGVENTSSPSDKKSRAPQPPSYPRDTPKNDIQKNTPVNSSSSEKSHRPSLPPPDYEALFPKKRHGVMADTRWEHIVAEVNQRKTTSQIGGTEMSVDGPDEPVSSKPPILKERSKLSSDQHHRDYQVMSSASTKGIKSKPALIPPKPAHLLPTKQQPEADSEQGRSHVLRYSVHGEKTKTDLGRNPGLSVQSQPDTQKRTDFTFDQISEPQKEKPTPAARNIKKPTSTADQSCDADTTGLPLAKPRQGAPSKEPARQVQPEQSTLAFTSSASSQAERKKEGSVLKTLWENEEGKPTPVKNTDETLRTPKEQPFANVAVAPEAKMPEFDPFPSDNLISRDPWALPQQTDLDDFFTSGPKKGTKPEDQRLSSDDFDDIFGSVASKNEMDPFFGPKGKADIFLDSVDSKNAPDSKASQNSQKVYSHKKKLAPQPPEKAVMRNGQSTTDEPVLQEVDDVELTVTSLAGPKGGATATELLSGGKGTLCAWVSPSEVQSGTSQSSGGGLVLTSRRPHPVKPMSPYESQSPGGISTGKEMKVLSIREMAEKSKQGESGPYTQLTQEELITLVVKQQSELSKKDEKILELEDYIDNLLVRVIDEQPGILLTLNCSKA